jgi:hypothetical protein
MLLVFGPRDLYPPISLSQIYNIIASSLFGMGSNDRLFRPMDVSQFG